MNKKILIIRLGAIGDVIHSSVIQQSIKNKHPDSVIHFFTDESIAPLIKNDIYLDKVFAFNPKQKDNIFYLLSLGIKFRKEKYDVIINLSNSLRNLFLLQIAAPKQIVKRGIRTVHAIDAFFNSAKEVYSDIEYPKNLSLKVNQGIKEKLQKEIIDYPRPYIIFSPGGENNNNRQGRIWSYSNWSQLSEKILNDFGGTIFVVGSPSEKTAHTKLINNEHTILFSGKLTLEESACLFSLSDLFISGDSGPLHMASALNIPTIGIMGSTLAKNCGPYGAKCYSISPSIECSGCGQKICNELKEGEIYAPCIQSITPDMILNLIKTNKLI